MNTVYLISALGIVVAVINVLMLMQSFSKRVIVFQNILRMGDFKSYMERVFWKAKASLRNGRERSWNNKFCTAQDNELYQLVKKHGFDGLIFMYPMRRVHSVFGLLSYTSSSDDPQVVPCVIENDEMTTFEDGHKVRLRSIYPGYGTDRVYTSTLESFIKSGTCKVYKDIKANEELNKLRSAWGDDILAVIRVPERSIIENALNAEEEGMTNADKIRELLFNCVIDDPKYVHNYLRLGNSIVEDKGNRTPVIETGTHCRISQLEALERLETVNHILCEIFPYHEDYKKGRVIPEEIKEKVTRMLKLTESTHLRDDFEEGEDEEVNPSPKMESEEDRSEEDSDGDFDGGFSGVGDLDTAGRVMLALKDEGDAGFVFALRAMGMRAVDIASVLGKTKAQVSNVINKTIGREEKYAWIYELVDNQYTTGWKSRKYTKDQIDTFYRVASYFTGECDDVPAYDFDLNVIKHRFETRQEEE